MPKKWIAGILLTLLMLGLITIKVYPIAKSNWWNEKEKLEVKEQDLSIKEKNTGTNRFNVSHRSPYVDETFPFRTLEEEEYAKQNPEKFQVVNSIYYAWDKVDTVNGEYKYKISELDDTHHIKFYADYEKFISYTEEETQTETGLFRENRLEDRFGSTKLIRQKLDEKVYNILNNSDSFGMKLGLATYLIEGSISKEHSEMLEGPFTMIVSKETGIILDAKLYGKSKEPMVYIEVEKIHLNEGNPEDIFQLI
ncbi:hypothetical protein NSQ89_21650 [Niallia sp. FSL R7-0648]|uniref:hypothetical protein n=1 Tax=Niallia sp. FSL R7-0648 TaxID=2954521 RepID=UPI0030FB3A28